MPLDIEYYVPPRLLSGGELLARRQGPRMQNDHVVDAIAYTACSRSPCSQIRTSADWRPGAQPQSDHQFMARRRCVALWVVQPGALWQAGRGWRILSRGPLLPGGIADERRFLP